MSRPTVLNRFREPKKHLIGVPGLVLSFNVDLPEFYITIMAGSGQDSAIRSQSPLTDTLWTKIQ